MEGLNGDNFCIEKSQPVGELTIEEKVKNVEILIEKKHQDRLKIDHKLELRMYERFRITMELENRLSAYGDYHGNQQRDAVQHLRRALDEYHRVEEHEIQIKHLSHRLKSGRNSSVKEKQILREIECVQEQKQNFCADLEAKKWIPWYLEEDNLNSKELIEARLLSIINELNGSSMEPLEEFHFKDKRLKKRLLFVEKDICSLEKKLEKINHEVKKLNASVLELRRWEEKDYPEFMKE